MYCYIVRLACVKPAASVRSEPESNSQVLILTKHLHGKHLRHYIPSQTAGTQIFGNTHNITYFDAPWTYTK
jgi:hypothetical protein